MRYDEDDLYEYSDGSFDEGEAIDEVIDSLKPEIEVTEAQAEAELDKVDWDIDAAVANLRKRYAKPAPKPQQPAPKGKLTPLQMLAQRRNQSAEKPEDKADAPTENNIKPSLAQLASLRRAKLEQQARIEQQTSDQRVSSTLGAQKDGDASASNRSALNTVPNIANLSAPSLGLSALQKLRQRKAQASKTESNTESKAEPKTENYSADQPLASFAQAREQPAKNTPQKWAPLINYDYKPVHINPPSAFGELIGTAASIPHQNRITNTVATAKAAQSAFSKPSPDDIVLNAQEQAFNAKPTSKAAGNTKNVNKSASAPPSSVKPTNVAASNKKLPVVNKDTLITKLGTLKLKNSCSFVVIGHVDAGKSTLMGRLLLDTGALSAKVVKKFEHESSKAGKSSFWLAWAMDATTEERERGVTVDIGEANFETDATRFTVLDAPGHRDYVPNMIAGVAQADLAVLVVDADTNAFESGFSLDGQTKEHAVLARSLGLERIIVAVNKMDTQNWSEERFDDITAQLTEFLTKKVGYNVDQLFYVPTSGITGDNVVKKGSDGACSWYTGPSLVGSLDQFAQSRANKEAVKEPLRFLVTNAFVEPFQSNITVTGRVLTGCVEAGDPVELVSLHETAKVKSLDREFLVAGEQGELKIIMDNIKLDDGPVAIRPGDVIAGANANLHPVTKFVAKVRVFDIPRPILPGTKMSFHLGRVDDMVKVTKIVESLNIKKTAPKTSTKLRHLGKGAAARVELELANPAILSTTQICKDLGRFVLRLNGATVGGGVVEKTLDM